MEKQYDRRQVTVDLADLKAGMKEGARFYRRMEEKAGFNGWTNWETWLVDLWLTNDQGTVSQIEEMALEELKRKPERAYDYPVYRLAKRLKELTEELAQEIHGDRASFVVDLVNGCLSSVDWQEIARHFTEE